MGNGALMKLNAERYGDELDRVEAAVSRLLNRPAKVDFYSVAAESGVSRSTLYRNPQLRLMVETVRDSQPDPWELIGRLAAENERLCAKLAALETRNAHNVHERMIGYGIMEIPLVA